ncbi:MAG: rod shape-determining protein MreC [Candidatus Cryptobacteroides sp.]
MPRKRTILGTIINTAVFIILEIAALNMLTHNGQLQNFFISKASHWFMGKVWGATESVRYYASLKKENERLSEEILTLTRRVAALSEAESEKEAEARLVVPEDNGKYDFIPAEIIKSSVNKQHNYLIIGKGSDDGIVPQTGVITANGVIGIIDVVSRHYSYAISFLNSETGISSRIGKDGAVGPMSWSGTDTKGAVLREIPLQYRFEPGDTVYTSGFSSIFPAGIPLGTIVDSKIVNGATYEIRINLLQDFSAIRYVTLVKNRDIKEIEDFGDNDKEGGR